MYSNRIFFKSIGGALFRTAVFPLAAGLTATSGHSQALRSVHFVAASHNLPEPSKAHRGGEDASFFSAYALGTAGICGVTLALVTKIVHSFFAQNLRFP